MPDRESPITAENNTGLTTDLAVVAIGGNSLIADSSRPEIVHQWDAVNETTGQIAQMLERRLAGRRDHSRQRSAGGVHPAAQ